MNTEELLEQMLDQVDFKTLLDLYENVMKPRELTLEGLWQVRFWDGMDGTWSDHGPAQTPHEALKEWFRRTEGGTKNTNNRDDVDYFRVFPANTVMAWGDGREMHRGGEALPQPDPIILVENKKRRPPWRFELALQLTSALEKGLSTVGWHIGMAGSVLHKGESLHDLDVIVYPRTTAVVDLDAARKVFAAYGMTPMYSREEVLEGWKKKGSTDEKHVEIWKWHHYRIDVFFLK